MFMYSTPVIWSGENQLTADTISLTLRNGKMDSLVMYNSSFIISKDDSTRYNQIKGKNVVGYFLDNRLYKIRVFGNAETIYFVREDDGSLIGVNKGASSNMLIFAEENQVRKITYIGNPAYNLYPEKDLAPNDMRLRGFIWHGEKRPLEKQDIFK
jgi:hypothetical protein